MKGYLITYKDGLKRNDITKINYYLFGRIVHRKTQTDIIDKYYYPGLFEVTSYVKLSNGCYFTEKIVDNCEGRLHVNEVEITLPQQSNFVTARKHWEDFINKKGWIVRNF